MKKIYYVSLFTSLISLCFAININCSDLMQQGEGFLKEKNYKNAREYFSKAVEADPKSYRAYLKLGLADVYLSEMDKARENFLKADMLNPGLNTDIKKMLGDYLAVYTSDPGNVAQRQPLIASIMQFDPDLIGVSSLDLPEADDSFYGEFIMDYIKLYENANIEQLHSLLRFFKNIHIDGIDLNGKNDCLLAGSGDGFFSTYSIFLEFNGKIRPFETGSYNASTVFLGTYNIAGRKEKAAVFAASVRNGTYLENLKILNIRNSQYELDAFCTDCNMGDVKAVDLDHDGVKEIICLKAAENESPSVSASYNFPFIYKWNGSDMADKTLDYPDYLIQHYSKMLNSDKSGYGQKKGHLRRMNAVDEYIIKLSGRHGEFWLKNLKPLRDKYFGVR